MPEITGETGKRQIDERDQEAFALELEFGD